MARIILASASLRRKELLESAGIVVEVRASDIAEVGYGGDPAHLPLRMAKQKVKSVRAALGPSFDGWILGADTVVALQKETFGKPHDEKDARRMLERLSGREHTVYTGFRVEGFDGDFREGTVATVVEFAPMTSSEIDTYIRSGEPFDKAGAYAIQGKGGRFVRAIRGSYSNVVGLPLFEVIQALRELGAIKDT
ncbi:MAG TPA: Maf family protein [Bdellovibrionota bacterium]|nr:Maf family protein [Bdellovibrionota bacterium]